MLASAEKKRRVTRPQGMTRSGYPRVRECGKGKALVSELGWTKEEDDSSGIKWSMQRERPLEGSLLEISVMEDV